MKKIQDYLNKADPQDFVDCLKENFERDSDEYFKMLTSIYYNDKIHFDALSDGCKAALLIYIKVRSK